MQHQGGEKRREETQKEKRVTTAATITSSWNRCGHDENRGE